MAVDDNKTLVSRIADDMWNKGNLEAGDEVMVASVIMSHNHELGPISPARFTIGKITEINQLEQTFTVNAWSWYGYSGSPIILRRTGEVIGLLARAADGHENDASSSVCVDFTRIMSILNR